MPYFTLQACPFPSTVDPLPFPYGRKCQPLCGLQIPLFSPGLACGDYGKIRLNFIIRVCDRT